MIDEMTMRQRGSVPTPGGAGGRCAIGWWRGDVQAVAGDDESVRERLHDLAEAVVLVEHDGRPAVARGGFVRIGPMDPAASGTQADTETSLPVVGFAPALHPRQLGDPTFCVDHGLELPYMTGAMANGIASVELVEAMAKAGMLGAYGAAGQRLEVIRAAIERLQASLCVSHADSSQHGAASCLPYCFNLIHSPNEPLHEMRVVELYLEKGVTLVEASAYLDLTLPVVRYRVTGLTVDGDGEVVARHRIIAKASRVEVAGKWFAPPPRRLVDELVKLGHITREEADLSQRIPMAQDLTAEADSGGHTDNRPAITLIPTFIALRDRLQREHGFDAARLPLRVGAGGGIATPASAAAAFSMGAAYIVTGSINQACVESGSSDAVRMMLAQAQQADTIMAPAADMFEMGVKLQVLRRGTMFAMRAQKLFELYRAYPSIAALPQAERANIEKTIFRATLDEIWTRTVAFFEPFDPGQIEKARRDPKHQMALIFRWYLGLSSRWANAGDVDRQLDYQVWCGPAMGAFNEWTRGSFLEQAGNRKAAVVAWNLMAGAAVLARVNMLRAQGVRLDAAVAAVEPREMAGI